MEYDFKLDEVDLQVIVGSMEFVHSLVGDVDPTQKASIVQTHDKVLKQLREQVEQSPLD